jgi:CBS domain-containing protein/ribosome-associated translation inhibitor RaiA
MEDISSFVRTKRPWVKPEDRVSRVALVLSRTRSNVAMVRDGRRLVGCVMRRQLLRPPLSPDTKAERLLMHPPLLSPDSSVEDAIALFVQSGCDSLPVMRGDSYAGTVMARDLGREVDFPGTLADMADEGVPPAAESRTIAEVAAILRDHDLESIPVVDEAGEIQGWARFQEIHSYILAPEKGVRGTGEFVGEKIRPLKNPVSSIARPGGATVESEMEVRRILATLATRRVNEVTVVEDRRALSQLNVVHMLSLLMARAPRIPVQVAGMEGEDPFEVNQVISGLETTAAKIGKICARMQTPEIKVKAYKHRGSGRKRYDVRVTFHVPEQYVAEAKGWDLITVSQQAIKKAEREVLRARSKVIDSHHKRRKRSMEGV